MPTGYVLGAPVMMQLGAYQFAISSAAYQTLQRSDAWEWSEQARFGQAPALQYTGTSAPSVTLDGVIYPEWRGGNGQIEHMRAEAAKGRPLVLVDGLGRALGMWTIERLDETQGTFAAGGVARRIEFALTLKRFSASVAGPTPKIPPLPVPPPVIPASAVTPAAQTAALARNAGQQAADAATAGVSAYERLKRRLAPGNAVLSSAAGGLQRAVETAREIKRATDDAQRMLSGVPGTSRALSITRMLSERVDALGVRAQSAERVLRGAAGVLQGAQGDNWRAVVSAVEAAGKTSAVARVVVTEARKILEAGTIRPPKI